MSPGSPIGRVRSLAGITSSLFLLHLARLTVPASAGQDPIGVEPPLDELIRSETEFAAAGKAHGIRDSVLEYLAEGAILFRPGPVDGRAWMTSRPAPKGLLVWYPALAQMSGAGDLGFTSGPFEFRAAGPDDPQAHHGTFFSIWQRQDGGLLRVMLDGGTSHPKLELAPEPLRPGKDAAAGNEPSPGSPRDGAPAGGQSPAVRNRPTKSLSRRKWTKQLDHLADLDRSFCAGAPTADPGREGSMRDDALVLFDERQPAVGAEALDRLRSDPALPAVCRTAGRGLAKSGDLAYTYGSMTAPPRTTEGASGGVQPIGRQGVNGAGRTPERESRKGDRPGEGGPDPQASKDSPTASGSGPLVLAHYVAVWRREPGGPWRLAVFLHLPMPPPAAPS